MSYTIRCECGCGRRVDEYELCPVALTLTATPLSGVAFMDPTELSPGVRFVVARSTRRVELSGPCAHDLLLLHPALVERLVEREVTAGRMPEQAGAKTIADARAHFEARVRAEYEALAATTPEEE